MCMQVLFTNKIPCVAVHNIQAQGITCDVVSTKSHRQLLRAVKAKPYDGIVTLLTDKVDRDVIEAMPSSVKVIANYAVGYNNINLEAATERGITVTNTPGVLTDTVAEHTVGMVFALSCRITEADSFVRWGKFKGWEPELLLGFDLKGKVLGILGAGRIGSRVAELLHGIGMKVIYYDVVQNEKLERSTGATFVRSPEEVLERSDVISIHLPLNDSTYHFLNEARLARCKREAVIINASRGAVIDEDALIHALRVENIRGAALDVFEHEPKVPWALRRLSNVVLSPHTASASIETRDAMARLVAENVIAVLQAGVPPHPVNL